MAPEGAAGAAGAAKRKLSGTQQKFHYFLVYDFEATCERSKQLHPQVSGGPCRY